MVSFVCDVCQETLKKAKLDTHKSRCNQAIFSCIDCYKTFSGIEYRSHTSCITEVQKYHKKPSKLETFLNPKGDPLIKSLSNDSEKDHSGVKESTEKTEKDKKQDEEDDGKEILFKALKKKTLGYQKISKKFGKKGKDFTKLLSKASFQLKNGTIILQL